MKFSRSVSAKVAVAALALAAAGTASVAQARSDVFFSIGANVAPGVAIGVTNAPVYYAPPVVYSRPYYVQPVAPVYYAPPVYVQPAPVFYGPPVIYGGARFHGHRHNRHWDHRRR